MLVGDSYRIGSFVKYKEIKHSNQNEETSHNFAV